MANSYDSVKYNEVLNNVMPTFTGDTSIFKAISSKFNEELNRGGLDATQLGAAMSQFYLQAYAITMSEANKATLSILDSYINDDNKTKQNLILDSQKALLDQQKASETNNTVLILEKKNQVIRETNYYDDQKNIKKAEFLANVASFAVNADSASAQDTLNNLNTAIAAI